MLINCCIVIVRLDGTPQATRLEKTIQLLSEKLDSPIKSGNDGL